MTAVDLASVDILGYGPVREDLDAGRLGLVWGKAVVFADHPGKVMATSAAEARAMSVQMDVMDRVMSSKRAVVISSPYFVPGSKGVREFGELTKREVRVEILTNSLADRRAAGARRLFALPRPNCSAPASTYTSSAPRASDSTSGFRSPGSLGAAPRKGGVIDGSTVYIGSMNLDPRSDSTNTELGLIAECPELAAQIIRVTRGRRNKSSYRVRFATRPPRARVARDRGAAARSCSRQEPEVRFLDASEEPFCGPSCRSNCCKSPANASGIG